MATTKKRTDYSHIELSDMDTQTLKNAKILLEIDKNYYSKMLTAIDAENFICKGFLSRHEEDFLLLGGAIMYQLMNNPDFLNKCKNIHDANR